MKLTLEHLGKKIQYPSKVGYLLLKGFKQERDGSENIRLITDAYNGHDAHNGDGVGWFNDSNWTLVTGEEISDSVGFDFNRFGCNRQHVVDLIRELDKRYQKSTDIAAPRER